MPAYLSEGNRHYNQIRQISSRDPIAQLEYYLPNPSRTSSSTISSESSGELCSGGNFKNKRLQLDDGQLKRFKSRIEKQETPKFESSGFSEGTIVELTNRESYRTQKPIDLRTSNPNSLISAVGNISGGALSSDYSKERDGDITPDARKVSRAVGRRPSTDKRKARKQAPSHQQQNSNKTLMNNGNATQSKRRIGNKNRRRVQLFNNQAGGLDYYHHQHMIDPYALSELFSQSEIPGFREIFSSDSYLRKLCWIIAFLVMTFLSVKDALDLLQKYHSHPVSVDVRHRDSARLTFPSVTVCNLNVVRFTALCESQPTSLRPGGLELSKQILPELRHRLCGLQLEKKNATGGGANDQDLSDINNIGLTTTTTTTSTTTTIASATTTASGTTTTSSTTITPPPITLNSPTGAEPTSADNSTALPKQTTSTTPQSIRSTSTIAGGLDLGLDLLRRSAPGIRKLKRTMGRLPPAKRSIKFSEAELKAQGEWKPRPFASSKNFVKVFSSGEQTDRRILGSGGKFQASHGGQRQGLAVGQNPIGSAAAIGAPPNAFQNPILNTVAATTTTTTTTTPPSQTSGNLTTFSPPIVPEDFEFTERQERELQQNLTNSLAVLYQRDPQLTLALGHQFEDMILRCTMKSVNCTHRRSFDMSFTPTEGNCFTYRSRSRRRAGSQQSGASQYEEANLAGINDGLELVLNLERNEYVTGSSQVGALVMVHHPGESGYAAGEATFVPPEYTTYIGLRMVNITRLTDPHPEKCVNTWPDKFADALTSKNDYSQQLCLKRCLQKTIQNHCRCQNSALPMVDISSSEQTGSNSEQQQQRIIICDTRKQAIRQCVHNIMIRATDRVHNCECPPKCQVVRYDKTISMAKWPTYKDKVLFDRGKMDVKFENLAKVIVYFQTMTCEDVEQKAVFSSTDLASALGGIMGMYVGFSFLSVFEIFEVMSRKMWHHFRVKLANRASRLAGQSRA